jgi:hypothetical protein
LFNSPVLFLVFNRPDLVRLSFSRIREYKPAQLFVAADGPRQSVPTDIEKCREALDFVRANVDWPCEVNYLLRENNLGCGNAVSEAITWFFQHVERGIILEDDCIPNLSFFSFCNQLLEKYQSDKSVFQISGSNWQQGINRGEADYYFSYISSVWGWATWKDRWSNYDFRITSGDEKWKAVEKNLKEIASSQEEARYHLACFEKTANGAIDTWDYQWRYLLFCSKGKNIVPNVNLVTNAGYREDGTHTFGGDHWRSNLPSYELTGSLKHPASHVIDSDADRFLAETIWIPNVQQGRDKHPIMQRVISKIKQIIK